MKKRILSVFLIVCLCAALLPTFAAAESTIQGKGTEADPWILTQKVFDEASDSSSPVSILLFYSPQYLLSEGYYQLKEDITLNMTLQSWYDVTLDLNGLVLRLNSDVYGGKASGSVIINSGSLTLNDSNPDATHKFKKDTDSHGNEVLVLDEAGDIEIKGGIITGGNANKSESTTAGGGVNNQGTGFTMNGGTIIGCRAELSDSAGVYSLAEFRANGGSIYDAVCIIYGPMISKETGAAGTIFYGNVTDNVDSVRVTFDSNGGSAVTAQTVIKGWTVKEPTAPTRGGHKFTGWFDDDGNLWDFETVVTGDITLTAHWEKEPDGVGGLVAILDDVPFVDVDFNDYYYDSVKWAYHSGVTGGTDAWHFSPDVGCTRAQAVTFLWRAAGCPSAGYLGNFSDVDADAYYAPAVAWAVANGVTNGTSATTFSPDAACSRGEIVTFLFRAFGGTSNGYHPFGDVNANAYYADAVAWAYEHNVTGGTSADKFSPAEACTRAQIVTFLYRVLG